MTARGLRLPADLDSLQQNGGRATFFMVGTNVDSNAAVIRRMAEQGCEVANHTNDHKYLTKIGAEGIRSQVGSVNQKIASACGVSPVLMRPARRICGRRITVCIRLYGYAGNYVVY